MVLTAVQSYSAYDSSTLSSSASSSSSSSSLNDPVLAFMEYATETPAQRMFDNWLNSQNVSMDQYNSMTDAEKTALMNKYQEFLREKLEAQMGGTSTTAVVTGTGA